MANFIDQACVDAWMAVEMAAAEIDLDWIADGNSVFFSVPNADPVVPEVVVPVLETPEHHGAVDYDLHSNWWVNRLYNPTWHRRVKDKDLREKMRHFIYQMLCSFRPGKDDEWKERAKRLSGRIELELYYGAESLRAYCKYSDFQSRLYDLRHDIFAMPMRRGLEMDY